MPAWSAVGAAKFLGNRCGRETRQPDGHFSTESEAAKDSDDAAVANGRVEVFQIEFEDETLPEVWSGVGDDGPSLNKSMGRGMWRDAVENFSQNLSLNRLEQLLGGFNQPVSALSLLFPLVVVVGLFRRCRSSIREVLLCEPGEPANRNAKPVREILRRAQGGKPVVFQPARIGIL